MFNRVTIIGVGLLGGSLARDLRAKNLVQELVGVCRSKATADRALKEGVVDLVLPIESAIEDADLVVLATPMQAMVPILKSLEGNISEQVILTDVGSVKTDLYEQVKKACPTLLNQFVLAHPIAGGHESGVQASRLNLFKNKCVVITDTSEVSSSAIDTVHKMWTQIGAQVTNMSLRQHDATFAKTSHLPHLIAFSLVNYLWQQSDNERLFDLAAAGFYDFTRIASSDAEMWRDICITNREEIVLALDGFKSQVESIRTQVADADQDAILNYFGEAKNARDSGLLKKAEALKEQEEN